MKYCVQLVTVVLLASGCSILDDTDPSESTENNGRIILRVSIDSIELGFTPEEVRPLMLQPVFVGRGDYAGVHYSHYAEGVGVTMPATMEVFLASEYDRRAIEITVRHPYPGRTKEGVGLFTPKDIVRKLLGPPDSTEIHGSWGSMPEGYFRGDAYCGGDSIAMVFGYNSTGRVNQISLVRLRF